MRTGKKGPATTPKMPPAAEGAEAGPMAPAPTGRVSSSALSVLRT